MICETASKISPFFILKLFLISSGWSHSLYYINYQWKHSIIQDAVIYISHDKTLLLQCLYLKNLQDILYPIIFQIAKNKFIGNEIRREYFCIDILLYSCKVKFNLFQLFVFLYKLLNILSQVIIIVNRNNYLKALKNLKPFSYYMIFFIKFHL